MISALQWVPAGVADPNPKKYEFSAAEVELMEMMAKQKLDDPEESDELVSKPKESPSKSKKTKTTLPKIDNNLPADLRMDEYSSDEDENDAVQGAAIGQLLLDGDNEMHVEGDGNEESEDEEAPSPKGMEDDESDDDDDLGDIPDTREYAPLDLEGLNSIGLSQVGSNAPVYMDLPGEGEEDDDDSEAEDVQMQPDDAIVVVAKTEEDFAALEVHVYEQNTGNLFVHHDIPLPSFPLCLAHGDIGPTGTAGNFCAVGTFSPGIEIWNLDVLNALEPSCILGGEDTSMADEIMRHNMMTSGKKNKAKAPMTPGSTLRAGSHTDAVMSLSWNKVHRQVIASGSGDCTVKLWDVTQAGTDQCNAGTLNHHKSKVQSVLWHPSEGTLLATGSYDRTVALVDARSQENVKRVRIPADCEALAWDPFCPQHLVAASEDGTIKCWDVRQFSDKTPLWSVVANEYGGVSDLSYNPHVPGMLATCSVDKTVTLWDTYNAAEKITSMPPKACGNKEMGVGKLYSVSFYPSSPWLMACAGGAKEMALWDMSRDEAIQNRFGDRVEGNTGPQPTSETDETTKKEEFDSMMSADNPTKPTQEETKEKSMNSSSKKKKSGNKKKKVHRARR